MLISFSLQNWMSFKDKIKINMVASRQTTYKERLPLLRDQNIRVIPIAAIYGANASGKSNICNALTFARHFIKKGTKTIDEKIGVQPFLLCASNKEQPSIFTFEIATDKDIYEYSFSATIDRIHGEKLTKLTLPVEKLLFERTNQKIEIFEDDLEIKQHLENIRQLTRPNELFLTKTIENNSTGYKDVYLWFTQIMTVITPTSKLSELDYIVNPNHPYYSEAIQLFNQLDTGVLKLGIGQEMEFDLDSALNQQKDVPKETIINLIEDIAHERFLTSSKDGKQFTKSVLSFHRCEDGTEIPFTLNHESDGTKRLLDLLPAFLSTKPGLSSVFVIDEIDRSLHYLLLRFLLEKYLRSCNLDSRTQILFTTHDLLLMDQKLFRRDEMLVVEKNNQGASSVVSLDEYKNTRLDKDIRKSYIQGRFGGIPHI
jgi:uncharacterized protein